MGAKECTLEVVKENEEHSKVAEIIGYGAGIAAAGFMGVVLNQVDTSSMKGIMKMIKPLAVFGIAHWVAGEAAEAATDEVDEYIGAIKGVTELFKDVKEEMKKEDQSNG